VDSIERERDTEDATDEERGTGSDGAEDKPPVEDEVDEASDQSFPASDPPAY
jgi:hypothetical protein